MSNQTYPIISEFVAHLENISLHVIIDRPFLSENTHSTEQSYSVHGESALSQIRHSHISAELFVCQKGELLIDTPSSMLVLHASDILLIPPGIQHYKIPNQTQEAYQAIRISCKQLNTTHNIDLWKRFSPFFQGKDLLIYRNRPEVADLVAQVLNTACFSDSLFPALRAAEILLYLTGQNASSLQADSDYNRLSILEQWITTHFMQSCTLEEMAEKLHMSPRQVDRISRKHFGMSFHQAIIERRITTAEKMLLTTDMTAEKIGFAVGFSSLSGFYREFTKKNGSTPAAYRKKESPT